MDLVDIAKNKELLLAKKIYIDQYIEKTTEFMPIWEVFPNFRCPIVGSCLTIEEQRKIIKKTTVFKKRMSDFDAHHTLMEFISSENPVSVKTDRYIRRKYKTIIEDWQGKPEKELSIAWKAASKSGEMAGIFYIIVTRTDISNDLKMTAFGDIHMMGHTNMYDIMKTRKALSVEKEANKKLVERLSDERFKARQLKTVNKHHQKKIAEYEAKITGLTRQLSEKINGEVATDAGRNTHFKERLLRIEETLAVVSAENEQNLRDKTKLATQYVEAEATSTIIKAELLELITQKIPHAKSCCPQQCNPKLCETCEICPKKVLMIGGMTKMKPFYRDIIETNGNEFVYHDGYMKNKTRRLNDLVSGSDLVLCPVNCNSHNACLKIKKLCKKYNIPYKMMSGSSLSSVSRAVNPEQSA